MRRTSSRSARARSRARTPGTASPRACPTGTDEFGGISWLDFLADPDAPASRSSSASRPPASTTPPRRSRSTCSSTPRRRRLRRRRRGHPGRLPGRQAGGAGRRGLRVRPRRSPIALDDCAATYFADYSNYNSNLVGLVVDAEDIGLDQAEPEARLPGDRLHRAVLRRRPGPVLRHRGRVDAAPASTRRGSTSTNPALEIDPLVCRGFWGGGACDASGSDRGLDRLGRTWRRPGHPGAVPEQRAVAQPDGGDHQHRPVGPQAS